MRLVRGHQCIIKVSESGEKVNDKTECTVQTNIQIKSTQTF